MRELRHAGALLAEAGDETPLGVAFSKFARLARQAGDRQPNRALAADFLGERATPALTRSLVRWLPLTHLVGFYSVRRQVLVAAAANIVMFGVLGGLIGYLADVQPAATQALKPPRIQRADGVMPLVRRTAAFNHHREFITALFKHPPARRLLLRAVVA